MSDAPLRIGIMGTGSIGGWVGGTLAVSPDAATRPTVTFIGRQRLGDAVAAEGGLGVRDMAGPWQTLPHSATHVTSDLAALADCDVVLVCVKSAATEAVATDLAEILRPDALVVSLQNGLRNGRVLEACLGERTIVPGIVSFNVVTVGGARFHRTMDGPIMLQDRAHIAFPRLVAAMRSAGMHIACHDPLEPHQWTKLLVNLNNAISALSGAPTVRMLASPAYRRIIAAVVDEALAVLRASGIKPAKLRGVPIGLMPKILRLPTWLVKIVIGAQMKIDPEARSSMWEDLERRRPTEIDFLNGELVAAAERAGTKAPLNRRIVALVREAEQAQSGSPNMGADELWQAITSPSISSA